MRTTKRLVRFFKMHAAKERRESLASSAYESGGTELSEPSNASAEEQRDDATRTILIEIASYGRRRGKPRYRNDGGNEHIRIWNCARIENPSSSSRKGRTGLDQRLRSEVMRGELAQQFVCEAMEYCKSKVAELQQQSRKTHEEDQREQQVIRLGFGCEMGKHRSVSVAVALEKELQNWLSGQGRSGIYLKTIHRDIVQQKNNTGRKHHRKKWNN